MGSGTLRASNAAVELRKAAMDTFQKLGNLIRLDLIVGNVGFNDPGREFDQAGVVFFSGHLFPLMSRCLQHVAYALLSKEHICPVKRQVFLLFRGENTDGNGTKSRHSEPLKLRGFNSAR